MRPDDLPTKWEHGTRACYVATKCRCEPCRKANRDYASERNKKAVEAAKGVAFTTVPAPKLLARDVQVTPSGEVNTTPLDPAPTIKPFPKATALMSVPTPAHSSTRVYRTGIRGSPGVCNNTGHVLAFGDVRMRAASLGYSGIDEWTEWRRSQGGSDTFCRGL